MFSHILCIHNNLQDILTLMYESTIFSKLYYEQHKLLNN